ncbi:DUF4158 domain-containing protein [Pseudomonas aeruginosa]|nr:DUF4158 domain-containing protein [Pseudomonas aeruginosa]
MASLERTAYPVLSRSYSRAELQREFSFSEEEVTWVKSRSNAAFRLNLAVLFKTFQVLRYFPEIAEVPEPVVDFIRTQIGLRSKVALSPYKWMQLYRHMSAVREKLGVRLGIPRALGHPFHEHLDSDSTLTWTPIPRSLGH